MRNTYTSSREGHPGVQRSPYYERHRSSLRLLLLNESKLPLPASLLGQVLSIDPDARIRKCWPSLCEKASSLCATVDAIVAISTDGTVAVRHLRELCHLRAQNNYSVRPIYFAISRNREPATIRFDIERLGGHVLQLVDVPTHFQGEIDQIRLRLALLMRSLPSWLIVYEGNGNTLRTHVFFRHSQKMSRVPGSDRQIAMLAVLLKNNGIARSFAEWQKLLKDDALFRPAGGDFEVPSIGTIKMWLRRDFRANLQSAFDDYRSGFCISRVIEHTYPSSHKTKYRIRGEWSAIRK